MFSRGLYTPKFLAAVSAATISALAVNSSSPTATATPYIGRFAMCDNVDKRPVEEGLTTKKMYFYRAPVANQVSLTDRNVLLTLPHSRTLGKDVAKLLGLPNGGISVGKYNDGETSVKVDASVRGKDVFVLSSTVSNDSIIETLLTISTLRRASAKSICCIIPYYGYGRMDMKRKREPIAAADIARMFESMGVDSVILMDIHNDSVSGFFNLEIPVDNLETGPVAAAFFNEQLEGSHDVVIVAPHEGQVGRASDFRKRFSQLSQREVPMVFVSKTRLKPGEKTPTQELIGDVKGKTCVIVDDIVATGATLAGNVKLLKEKGASSVYAFATHGLFTGEGGGKRLGEMSDLEGLEYLLVTNTVYHEKEELGGKIKQLSVAPLIAEAIARTVAKRSISGILNVED